ncbi:MAG TPA: hypothetical protein VM031_04510 [Phycisphaerae bacterium]|nr:hypothetical protein [Phycisphaerae bacterium]
MIIDHDVHVHTNLSSCCHDPEFTVAVAVEAAAEMGLRTLGIANHCWDAAVPGASDWYRPQDIDHVLSAREQLPAETGGVRVLIGCETEYCGGGKFGISPAGAERLDFVLIPHSHFHMAGFTVPTGLSRAEDVARMLVERFVEVVESGLATGIAHPFLTLGFEDGLDAILALIPDGQYEDCFGRAAEADVSVELHVDMFPSILGAERSWTDETFLRIMGFARRAGCRFHFTSDAHDLPRLRSVVKLQPFADQLGLTDADLHPAFRMKGR